MRAALHHHITAEDVQHVLNAAHDVMQQAAPASAEKVFTYS
jgi:hypothetical protein